MPGTTMDIDAELSILEAIYSTQRAESRQPTQRELARGAGLSLGMTNVLIKRFSERGWVMIRKVNARTISYALTPEGINEIARRTYRFFRRTARNAAVYRELVEAFVIERKRAGDSTIVLGGPSDIDFLFEYACERHGIGFLKSADPERAARAAAQSGAFLVLSETAQPRPQDGRCALIKDILVRRSVHAAYAGEGLSDRENDTKERA